MKPLFVFTFLMAPITFISAQIVKKTDKFTGKTYYYNKPLQVFASGNSASTYIILTKGIIDSSIRINVTIRNQWVSNDAIIDLLYIDGSNEELKVDSVITKNALFPQTDGDFIGSYIINQIKEIKAFRITDPMFKFSRSVFLPSGDRKKLWKYLNELSEIK